MTLTSKNVSMFSDSSYNSIVKSPRPFLKDLALAIFQRQESDGRSLASMGCIQRDSKKSWKMMKLGKSPGEQ